MRIRVTAGCCLGLLFSAAAVAQAAQPRLILTDVRLLLPDASRFSPPSTVVVEAGRIRSVEMPVRTRKMDRVVDAKGLFAIPGLWDMHVHVVGNEDQPVPTEQALRMLVGNGVTGVRDMNGVVSPREAKILRKRVAAGDQVGPFLVYPGPIVDGAGRSEDVKGPRVVSVGNPQEARDAVRRLKSEGADFVKPYNRLDDVSHLALTQEARRLGLPVWGHVPHLVHPADAASRGQTSVEHMGNILEAGSTIWQDYHALMMRLAPAVAAGKQPPLPDIMKIFEFRRAPNEMYRSEIAAPIYRAFARHNTAWVPTLVSERAILRAPYDSSVATDPRMSLLPPSIAEAWKADAVRSLGRYGRNVPVEFLQGRELLMRRAVREAALRGAMILPGTDTGTLYIFPGSSLHDELEQLAAAGLATRDILLAATSRSARFVGMRDAGQLRPGFRADIVLLAADPLAKIDNVRQIRGVVLNGRYFSQRQAERLARGDQPGK